MKQLKLLGTAFISMLALTSITATLAQAAATLPNILPEAAPGATKIITAKSTSGKSVFGSSALEVVSEKSAGSQEGNSLKLGAFQVSFEESKNKLTGVKCNGLSTLDTTGIILVQGTFHIRAYKEGTLKTAAIFLLAPVHFSCGPTLVIVLGCVAGAISPENVAATKETVTLEVASKDNKIIKVLNEEATGEENCELLFAANGGTTFTLSSEETTQTLTNFKQNGVEISVTVMSL